MRRLLAVLVVLLLGVPATLPAEAFAARALLDDVQRRTFRWFWEEAHPDSGMTPERSSTPDVVTTGGTGFGLMGLVVGVERGMVSRGAARQRALQVATFLETADRFHGAWPHWLDGRTGKVVPFSPKDDGADLVETAFLVQGLLTARQFFSRNHPEEVDLRRLIDWLVGEVEWSWFTRGEEVLYWHWSPRHGWEMNLPIRGYNEALLAYVLAAGASRHAIDPAVYHRGWANSSASFLNGEEVLGIRLPLGPSHGGPLFLSQYSFLGIDPRGLSDHYADYEEQTRAHALLNWAYCVKDPRGHGYGRAIWGLSASDGPEGYAAHSPTNDLGVLAPTAALGSFPFVPERAWEALVGMRAWEGGKAYGEHGFRSALVPATGWVSEDHVAIDQGPILLMIENHRTGRIWEVAMGSPEIVRGLARLGFRRNLSPYREVSSGARPGSRADGTPR